MTVAAQVTFDVGGDLAGSGSALAGFVLLGSFLLSFVLIRISTRLMRSPRVPWWPGSIQTGGLHIHHLVFGIILLLLCGFLAIAVPLTSPWLEIVAAGFGIGAGLTLDEYALWLHLDDVYWTEDGRKSIDAVIVATVLAGLILLGADPLSGGGTSSTAGIAIVAAIVIALSLAAVLKGRLLLGLGGLIVPAAVAQRGDPPGSARLALGALVLPGEGLRMRRATARFDRIDARHRRWEDRIGGAPHLPRRVASADAEAGGGAGDDAATSGDD